MQPTIGITQLPSSTLASEMKLSALGSVQPRIGYAHAPRCVAVALESKLLAAASVHPSTT